MTWMDCTAISVGFARQLIAPLVLLISGCVVNGVAQATEPQKSWPVHEIDPPQLELVLQLVVTCTEPESIGGSKDSKDGKRDEIWPIVGGRFEGRGIRGTVIPGGGDFPVLRPDGVVEVDALYRLKTDDGVTIIIHNSGLAYPGTTPDDERYRLVPQFIAPVGKYDWLNRSIFVATLSDVPPGMALARNPSENDRLIQVYRVY